jgi:hypothetical protein
MRKSKNPVWIQVSPINNLWVRSLQWNNSKCKMNTIEQVLSLMRAASHVRMSLRRTAALTFMNMGFLSGFVAAGEAGPRGDFGGVRFEEIGCMMGNVIQGKKTTKGVVDAIIEWLWVPDPKGSTRIRFGKAEDRPKTPVQMLEMKEGACGELNCVFVALLGAVGIQARVCQAGWWVHRNDRHFYTEYWDAQLKEWVPWDSSDNLALRSATPRARQASGAWNSLVMHAVPDESQVRDPFNTESWEDCLRVTAHVGETYAVPMETQGEWDTAKAFVWNLGAWRCIDVAAKVRGVSGFEFGVTQRVERPVLFTATDGETLYWAMKRAGKEMGPVKLETMEPGVCLKWEAGQE